MFYQSADVVAIMNEVVELCQPSSYTKSTLLLQKMSRQYW